MNMVNLILSICIVILPNVQALYYPSFPQGSWDDKCSTMSLRRLPATCADNLRSDAPIEEKLACALISQPNTAGMFPLGLYPASMRLDEELQKIGANSLTKVFDDCALAMLIRHQCLSFEMSSESPTYDYSIKVDQSDFLQETVEKTGIAIGSSFDAKIVSYSIDIAYELARSRSLSFLAKTGVTTRSWKADIGTLKILDSCLTSSFLSKPGILYKPYFDQWRSIQNSNLDELLASDNFSNIAHGGLYFPTTFKFGTMYSSSMTTMFSNYTFASSYKEIMKAKVSGGFDAGVFGASVTVNTATSFEETASAKNVQSRTFGGDWTYGDCDYEKMNEYNWKDILEECTRSAQMEIEALPRAAYIPSGGFKPISLLVASQGIPLNENIPEALNVFYGHCRCVPNSYTFECWKVDGTFLKSRSVPEPCTSNFWWAHEDPPFKLAKKHGAYHPRLSFDTSSSGFFAIQSPDGRRVLRLDSNRIRMYFNNEERYASPEISNTIRRNSNCKLEIWESYKSSWFRILPEASNMGNSGCYLFLGDDGVLYGVNDHGEAVVQKKLD